MELARTYLFVPGNRPERFAKALASGADVVVLDLEDAVADEAKAEARRAIADWRDPLSPESTELARVALRINDAMSPHIGDDLMLMRQTGMRMAMLPKAESVEQLQALATALPGVAEQSEISPQLDRDALPGLCDLAHCLGQSGVMVDRVLASLG